MPDGRRWDAAHRERRRKPAHDYERVSEPSGHGRRRVPAGPDLVRPSTLLLYGARVRPPGHPCRFPFDLPAFFIKLLTRPGQVFLDPSEAQETAVAAERLGRRWLLTEADAGYAAALPARFAKGR